MEERIFIKLFRTIKICIFFYYPLELLRTILNGLFCSVGSVTEIIYYFKRGINVCNKPTLRRPLTMFILYL